ncbi:hypothetical protein EDB85DRAFT_1895935 [Lactarius pseudohatsudake]|nr:hypothetical protein EDB85DRAFT_1895935 [Lactarius pseudohatsudake]
MRDKMEEARARELAACMRITYLQVATSTVAFTYRRRARSAPSSSSLYHLAAVAAPVSPPPPGLKVVWYSLSVIALTSSHRLPIIACGLHGRTGLLRLRRYGWVGVENLEMAVTRLGTYVGSGFAPSAMSKNNSDQSVGMQRTDGFGLTTMLDNVGMVGAVVGRGLGSGAVSVQRMIVVVPRRWAFTQEVNVLSPLWENRILFDSVDSIHLPATVTSPSTDVFQCNTPPRRGKTDDLLQTPHRYRRPATRNGFHHGDVSVPCDPDRDDPDAATHDPVAHYFTLPLHFRIPLNIPSDIVSGSSLTVHPIVLQRPRGDDVDNDDHNGGSYNDNNATSMVVVAAVIATTSTAKRRTTTVTVAVTAVATTTTTTAKRR